MFVAVVGSQPFPTIYIRTNLYTSICLIFIKVTEYATNEITSPRTRNILAIQEHWPARIKMIPKYCMDMIISMIFINWI